MKSGRQEERVHTNTWPFCTPRPILSPGKWQCGPDEGSCECCAFAPNAVKGTTLHAWQAPPCHLTDGLSWLFGPLWLLMLRTCIEAHHHKHQKQSVMCRQKSQGKEMRLTDTTRESPIYGPLDKLLLRIEDNRRRTNVQQLTCNIDLSNSFYYFFFSFVLIELKPPVFKWKVLGEKF